MSLVNSQLSLVEVDQSFTLNMTDDVAYSYSRSPIIFKTGCQSPQPQSHEDTKDEYEFIAGKVTVHRCSFTVHRNRRFRAFHGQRWPNNGKYLHRLPCGV